MTYGYPPKHKPPTPTPATLEALREKLDPNYAPKPVTDADLPTRLSAEALNATYEPKGAGASAAAAAVAPLVARPLVTAVTPSRSVSDSIVHVRQGLANAVMLRQTELARQVAIIQNLGANDMLVAEGAANSLAAPASGYVTVTAGQEYVTASTKPVFAYMSTTAATARVYCAQGV